MRLSVVIALHALALGASCLIVQGPLPCDVAIARAVQAAFGTEPSWAQWLTDTAKSPVVFATLIVGAGMSWLLEGSRRGLAVPLAFGLAWLIDMVLRATIFVPRPTPDIIAVASASASSGLPSTFGLTYGSIFGVVVFAAADSSHAFVIRALALAAIVAGSAARVVLGGHWPSQMLASVLLGLLASVVAIRAIHLMLLESRTDDKREATGAR